MMCFNWLKSKLCREYTSHPNFLEDISGSEVLTILKAEFPDATIIVSDLEYRTTTKEELKRFLKEDLTDKNRWVKEFYDCENFAFQLMGNISSPNWGTLSFGILLGKKNGNDHTINCFVDNDREVYLIEPQSDEIYKMSDVWNVIIILM